MHPSIQNIKRYHLAKVYRRDQPAMTKGRLREFYQCDFDIAGNSDPMLPDAEILRILSEVFQELGWEGKYSIQINHRGILDGIFEVCGVPKEKIRMISSAVDKLDKAPWEEVKKEMTEEKGLDGDIADRIWSYVQKKGGSEVLKELREDAELAENKSMKKGMDDMDLLFTYLAAFKVLDKTQFNLSLARGLDYYTGLIFEVITEGSAPPSKTEQQQNHIKGPRASKRDKATNDFDEDRSNDPSVGVGSVAAGGRYDELVGMFSSKSQIPCVGLSLGVDRIVSITKMRLEADSAATLRSSEVDVYVMAVGFKGFTGMLAQRLEVCRILWDAGIKTEFAYKQKPKLPAQFKAAETNEVPFAVILGEDEQAKGQVRVKELGLEAGHAEKDGVLVGIGDLVEEVKSRLRKRERMLSGRADDGVGSGKADGGHDAEQAGDNGLEAVTEDVDGLLGDRETKTTMGSDEA